MQDRAPLGGPRPLEEQLEVAQQCLHGAGVSEVAEVGLQLVAHVLARQRLPDHVVAEHRRDPLR